MKLKLVSLVIGLFFIIGCTSAKDEAQKYSKKLNPSQQSTCNEIAYSTVVAIASNDANLEKMKQSGFMKESKKEWTLNALDDSGDKLPKTQAEKERGQIMRLIVMEIFDDVHGMKSLKDLDLQHRAFVVCAKSMLKEK